MRNPLTRALMALFRRGGRSLLTLLAVLCSAAALVALQGITASSADRTTQRFTDMERSSIQVSLPASFWDMTESDLLKRLDGFPQITAAGTLHVPEDASTAAAMVSPQWGASVEASVAVGTNEGLWARGAIVKAGHPLPERAAAADPYTALLGSRLARELHITMSQIHPIVTVNGVRLSVAGIVNDGEDEAALATMLVISPETARIFGMLPVTRTVQVQVEQGTAQTVAARLAVALNPGNANAVYVQAPSDPATLRASLMADSRDLTAIVTAIMIAVTAFGIVNTMQMAVNERRREIGIDLALGAPRRNIALQFLSESMGLGFAGALLGLLVGAIGAGVCALAGGWRFLLPSQVLLVPAAGLVIGALAGLLPAWRASRVDPAELLRSS